jgi:hypothetical protein
MERSVPGIHVLPTQSKDVDGRVKPGHDVERGRRRRHVGPARIMRSYCAGDASGLPFSMT